MATPFKDSLVKLTGACHSDKKPHYVLSFTAKQLQSDQTNLHNNPQDDSEPFKDIDNHTAMDICIEDLEQFFDFPESKGSRSPGIESMELLDLDTSNLSLLEGQMVETPGPLMSLSPISMNSDAKRGRLSSSLSSKLSMSATRPPAWKKMKLDVISPARVTNLFDEFVKNSDFEDPSEKKNCGDASMN